MKKVLLVLAIIATLGAKAQDRVNRQKLVFEQASETLTNSTGWQYNKELGEWVDYNNVIDDDKDYKNKYKSLQGAYQMSNQGFKFNSLQIKTLIFEEKKYYILLHDNWTGRYKYPSIRQDWIEYKRVEAYIFDETEFKKLINYETITFLDVVKYDLEFDSFNETKLLDLIQTKLTTPKSSYDTKYGSKWGMVITRTTDNRIRFLTPTILSLLEKTKYSDGIYDFTKMYFETDIANFNKLSTF